MKTYNWLIFKFSKGVLIISGAACWAAGLLLFLSVIFNFPPYLVLDKGKELIGWTDYKKGIPLEVKLNGEIPDTSIAFDLGSGKSIMNFYSGSDLQFADRKNLNDSIIYSDIISTRYDLNASSKSNNHFSINGLRFETATLFIKPKNFGQKLLFSIPGILKFLVLGYCAWQLAMLLHFIEAGKDFRNINYRRLLKIGWAILLFEGFQFLFSLLQGRITWLNIDFSSSIPNYRQPFELAAYSSQAVSIGWLLAGAIALVIAKAFQKGSMLQEEKYSII